MPARGFAWVLAGLAVFVWVGAASAEAPAKSVRPHARPALAQDLALPAMVPAKLPAEGSHLRPRPRPTALVPPPPVALQDVGADSTGLVRLIRPMRRPDGLAHQLITVAPVPVSAPVPKASRKKQPEAQLSRKGSVCGDPSIKGEVLAPITSKVRGCGIDDPVRVTSVAGIRLSTPATINCPTAQALKKWIGKGLEPVYGKGKVVQLTIFGSYSCRPRNNQRGAKVSEHGRGNAIDIGGFTFANGKSTLVLGGYDSKMRKVHKAACGIFGTTLGPHSDGFHENHLHFDTARYRSGSYCR
jgi:hypothetical protein